MRAVCGSGCYLGKTFATCDVPQKRKQPQWTIQLVLHADEQRLLLSRLLFIETVSLLRPHWPRCERVLDIHYVSSFLPTALWTKGRWLENAPPTMRQESKHLSAGVTELHPQLPLTALKLCLKWRSCMRGLPNTPTAPDFLTVCGAPLKMHDPSTQNYSINVIQLLKY